MLVYNISIYPSLNRSFPNIPKQNIIFIFKIFLSDADFSQILQQLVVNHSQFKINCSYI
jgi:hypothetical protein